MYKLPKATPHWFVRLELPLRRQELFLIKLTLKFLYRILQKPKDSLVYKCYIATKLNMNHGKRNWFRQLRQLLEKFHLTHLLELLEENTSYHSKMRKINDEIEKAAKELQSSDIVLMKKSNQLFCNYSKNKTHVRVEPYLNADLCMYNKQLIMQLKTGVSHICYKGKVALSGKVTGTLLQQFYKPNLSNVRRRY